MLVITRRNGEQIEFIKDGKSCILEVRYKERGSVTLVFRGSEKVKPVQRSDGWTYFTLDGMEAKVQIVKFCTTRVRVGVLAPSSMKVRMLNGLNEVCNGPERFGNNSSPKAESPRDSDRDSDQRPLYGLLSSAWGHRYSKTVGRIQEEERI